MSITRLVVVLVVALVTMTGVVFAAAAVGGRLDGRLPDNTPAVSIDQPRGTVVDALSVLAKQTGWTLVVIAPESATSRPLTLQVTKRPAGEVLDLILDAGVLRASFVDGVLRVRGDAKATSREAWRERRGRRGSERVVF